MRILLVSVDSEKAKGGVAEWTRLYKIACQRLNIECDVVDTSAIGKIATQITSKRNLYDEYLRFIRIRRDLKSRLSRNHYDVVHFNTNIGFFGIIRDYYLVKIIKTKNIPIILHFHCDISFWVRNSIVHRYLQKTLCLSDKIFVLNSSSQSYLKTEFKKKSVIIPNFIDEGQIKTNKTINDTVHSCIFVGRLSFLKGIKEIYELASVFPKIKYVLVGEISEDSKTLLQPENVVLLGIKSHDEVIHLIDESDVFLFPSHTEGFSIALLEAMARGIPIIASNVGSNADMLENKGGIVLQYGEIKSWIQALNTLNCKKTRIEMSKWNIQKVKKTYSLNTVMNRIIESYRSSID